MSILIGTQLADTLSGTASHDFITGLGAGDRLYGLAGDDWLDGGAGDDLLEGGAGVDNLVGGSGNDRLDGGTGVDTMTGGLGDDVYEVGFEGDAVIESAGAGHDHVYSRAFDFTLPANVERLSLRSLDVVYPDGTELFLDAGINGTGNELANVVDGNGYGNTLSGLGGNDTLFGRAGNDILIGGQGNDYLDGGTGVDTMTGGIGNDTYIVDQTTDRVVEGIFLGGDDTVLSTATYALSADVETLRLTGTGAINGTGNAQANSIYGNARSNTIDGGAGADTMAGGGGNDVYRVDNAGDAVSESAGGGTDLVISTVSYSLVDEDAEDLTLVGPAAVFGTGNAVNNVMTGNEFINSLIGLGGNDQLYGGGGNDILQGGTGNDDLRGDSGNDFIRGGFGTDTIRGGLGIDTLRAVDSIVGANDFAVDNFVFDTAPNGATNFDLVSIAAFGNGNEATDDEILLENSIFTALRSAFGGSTGTLSSSHYFEGPPPPPPLGWIGIYNDTSTGRLYYNPTFGIAGDTVLFAVVDNTGVPGGSASLSAEEFTLV